MLSVIDLTTVLPTTFQVLDKSLSNIEDETVDLRRQCGGYYTMPAANTKLNKIMVI